MGMTIDEAIKELEWLKMVEQNTLETDILELGIDSAWSIHWKNMLEALDMAISAVKREQQFLDAGYKNGSVEFYIGGRKFVVRELAQ